MTADAPGLIPERPVPLTGLSAAVPSAGRSLLRLAWAQMALLPRELREDLVLMVVDEVIAGRWSHRRAVRELRAVGLDARLSLVSGAVLWTEAAAVAGAGGDLTWRAERLDRAAAFLCRLAVPRMPRAVARVLVWRDAKSEVSS